MNALKIKGIFLFSVLCILLCACVSREQKEVTNQKKRELSIYYIPVKKVGKIKGVLTLVQYHLDDAPPDYVLLDLTNTFLVQLLKEKGYTNIVMVDEEQTKTQGGFVIEPTVISFVEQRKTQNGQSTLFPDHHVYSFINGKLYEFPDSLQDMYDLRVTGNAPIINGKSAQAFYDLLNSKYKAGTAYDYVLHRNDYLPFYELCWQAAVAGAADLNKAIEKKIRKKHKN